jgi:hypothetical protein
MNMKRLTSILAISAMALIGGAIVGPVAQAADAPTLVLSGGSAVFGLDPAVIKATAGAAGKVKFAAVGVDIKGCESVATSLVAPFVANCTWTPSAAGATALTATLTPTDVAITPVNSPTFTVKVGLPVQGVVSPISIYVDTVLASGATGALAPRFGTGCAITSQYITGQGIVFRVFANNADLGGAVMDSSNTAKAYIEISGVATPIQLKYSNHSGTAFWAGLLRTGAAPLYNTPGVINFKVTMVAKDTTVAKVLSQKRVAVRDDAGNTTYQTVSYYRTRKLISPIVGATGTYTPSWAATSSLLTLYPLPA